MADAHDDNRTRLTAGLDGIRELGPTLALRAMTPTTFARVSPTPGPTGSPSHGEASSGRPLVAVPRDLCLLDRHHLSTIMACAVGLGLRHRRANDADKRPFRREGTLMNPPVSMRCEELRRGYGSCSARLFELGAQKILPNIPQLQPQADKNTVSLRPCSVTSYP